MIKKTILKVLHIILAFQLNFNIEHGDNCLIEAKLLVSKKIA